MPGPPRRLDTPEPMMRCFYAVTISQQAPTSSRAIAMVTMPAGLPRRLRSTFQRALSRRWTRQAWSMSARSLALDDDQRHALAGHLDGMRVAQLVRREAPTHPRFTGEAA
jgi:hypothetical protein